MFRIAVLDDQPLVRAGLKAAIALVPDLVAVGEPTDSAEAVRMCRELHVDVLLLDPTISGLSPLTILSTLRESSPGTRVIALTESENRVGLHDLVTSGLAGYVLKREPIETLVDAIRVVVKGGTWFKHDLIRELLDLIAKNVPEQKLDFLDDRERRMLVMIARGCTNRQIGSAR